MTNRMTRVRVTVYTPDLDEVTSFLGHEASKDMRPLTEVIFRTQPYRSIQGQSAGEELGDPDLIVSVLAGDAEQVTALIKGITADHPDGVTVLFVLD